MVHPVLNPLLQGAAAPWGRLGRTMEPRQPDRGVVRGSVLVSCVVHLPLSIVNLPDLNASADGVENEVRGGEARGPAQVSAVLRTAPHLRDRKKRMKGEG